MISESLLRLKLAFSSIPMKGLFFWEGLLFLDDAQYKKIVEDNIANVINSSVPSKDTNLREYYADILSALKEVRKSIIEDPEIKSIVEKIREVLITETAEEILLDNMRLKLKK